MRCILIAVLAALLWGCRPAADGVPSGVDAFIGTWKVDLRPTPDAEPYLQDFIVSSTDGNTFTAVFYGTEVSDGRLNTDWGSLRFAFVTNDGSVDYYSSGVLDGDVLRGTTHSPGRGLLAVWTATRTD